MSAGTHEFKFTWGSSYDDTRREAERPTLLGRYRYKARRAGKAAEYVAHKTVLSFKKLSEAREAVQGATRAFRIQKMLLGLVYSG